jgi:NTE family protein
VPSPNLPVRARRDTVAVSRWRGQSLRSNGGYSATLRAAAVAILLVTTVAILLVTTPTRAVAECATSSLPLDTPTALVLSGGGAKGAWEAGVATALLRGGLSPSLVAGSSAGALTAVMVADGRLDRLEATWRALTAEQVFALRPSVFFAGLLPGWLTLLTLNQMGSLLDPRPLRDLIAGALDLERVRTSPVSVLVVTTDLVRRRTRVFDNRTISIDALMAAAAVPGAFPPVSIDGDLLVDGGLVGRAPILEALASGVSLKRALVLMSYAAEERGEPPSTLRRTLEESFETTMVHQIRRDTELARLKYLDVEIQLLAPSTPLALRPLDFDAERLARAFELGRRDGAACLDAWRRAPD